ncbi:hypothetical protein OJAV_G00006730 [Oryzias javanicus]|uniref:C3H1-type domain-containing protein n=1 Tax=Oryzias javanicus TaxID=123683 RepID=A0A437DN54_ORYJA|nr:hypothetical protein OJAV_G00006730 [Oryzias javanicus]
MNSLVGYLVSSDSDSDEETGEGSSDRLGSKESGEKTAVQEGRNFLLQSDLTSSESEPEDDDPEPSSPAHSKTASSSVLYEPALPTPSFGSHNPNKLPPPPLTSSSDCSVFANPFKAQVDQRLIALQKHVPLTMQAKPSQIGGKRICVSYRKDGRCRFGIKCKFAHDSDLQNATASSSHPPGSEEPSDVTPAPGRRSQNPRLDFKEEEEQPAKKKRVGLSNTLIPPKKAMKQYNLQRSREQINTS